MSGPESSCDGELPPTAVAHVTPPPARLGLGPPWDVGAGPWHVAPPRAMIVIGVHTGLHVTCARSAGNDPPYCEDDEMKERTGAGRVLA